MDRIINVRINGNHLTKDSRRAGVQWEGNATKLRIEFDSGWDVFVKTVTFWDARGNDSVKIELTSNLIEDIVKNERIYLCPIPPEAMTVAGELTFVVDGYTDGIRQRSIPDSLEVLPAPNAEGAGNSVNPTPSDIEQLRAEIRSIGGYYTPRVTQGTKDSFMIHFDRSTESLPGLNPTSVVLPSVDAPVAKGSGVNSLVASDIKSNNASGNSSVALNYNNTASGNNSVATGTTTTASGAGAFSANCGTEASGDISTAFGNYTKATTTYAFSAGDHTEANGIASVALNHNNKVFSKYGLATGTGNIVGSDKPVGILDGEASGAFGYNNTVLGRYSTAQGYNQKNNGHFAHTFNQSTETYENSYNQTAFGIYNKAEADSLFMIGVGTSDTNRENVFEVKNDGRVFLGNRSLAFHKDSGIQLSSGLRIQVGDLDDFATRLTSSSVRVGGPGERVEILGGSIRLGEGKLRLLSNGSIWLGDAQLTEEKVNAIGRSSGITDSEKQEIIDEVLEQIPGSSATSIVVAGEGTGSTISNNMETNTAEGQYSHAEGSNTDAIGDFSHTEGLNTTASGDGSHAEGYFAQANGSYSHAEGMYAFANGFTSHAEGGTTYADGRYSHAEGCGTRALSDYQHVQGKYNVVDEDEKYAHIVGNGEDHTDRSNAHTLDWSGLGWFAGGLKVGGTSQDDENAVDILAYIQSLESRIAELENK